MLKPAIIPTFATDVTLSAGPQVGLAPRLDPGTGLRAQGYYQDRRIPARHLGWLLGVIGDWLKYLAPVQIKNWKLEGVDFLATTTTDAQVVWVPEGTGVAGQWFVFSYTSVPAMVSTRFPALVVASGGGPALNTWLNSAANADGSVLVAMGFNSVGAHQDSAASTDHGATWTLASTILGTYGALAYEAVSGRFIGTGNAVGSVFTATNGLVWTNRGAVAGATGQWKKFVAGGGVVVGITDTNQISFSSDGGISWTASVAAPVTGAIDLAYTSQYGWVIVGTTQIATSTNLTVWTTSSPFGSGKAVSIASDGVSRFAIAHRDTTVAPGPGIYFSDDGALTWEPVRFSANAETKYLPHAIRYNGHSQWAVMGTPTGATTGYSLHTSQKI